MNISKYDDPEWIQEKMFGEEFDSSIMYYVVNTSDQLVLYLGSLELCKQFLELNLAKSFMYENHAGLQIVDYSQLTQEMIQSIPEPF